MSVDFKTFLRNEVIILCVILYFMLDIWDKGYYGCFILPIYIIYHYRFLPVVFDGIAVFLILFSIFYSFFYLTHPLQGYMIIIVYLSPALFYLVGRIISVKYQGSNIFMPFFLLVSISCLIIPTTSIFINILENGFSGERNQTLLFHEISEIDATLMASYFTLGISSSGALLIPSINRIEKKIKLIILISFVISLICILRLASKTQLVVLSISWFFTLIYLLPRQNLGRRVKTLITLCFCLILFLWAYTQDLAIFDVLNQRIANEDTSYTLSASGRAGIWLENIQNIIHRPYGWDLQDSSTYAHNLWLDVTRVGGVCSLFFLVLFTISSFVFLKRVIRINKNDMQNIFAITNFYGMLAVFFVEPIMEGIPYLFMVFCLFIGLLGLLPIQEKFVN